MAQFIAKIRGTRGEASRLGSKQSGIQALINGWNVGVAVEISHEDGRDVVRVYHTGGSNGGGSRTLVAELAESLDR